MKMRSPASSDEPHADIAAKIDYRDMWEDQIHDVLDGYVDVPANPDPVRLRLTKAEIAHRLHMIACDALDVAKADGDAAAIAEATRCVDWTSAQSCFEANKAALGDLKHGRCLTYQDQDIRYGIYRVIDADGRVLVAVKAGDDPDVVRRLLAAYESGTLRGKADAQAAMREAMGLL